MQGTPPTRSDLIRWLLGLPVLAAIGVGLWYVGALLLHLPTLWPAALPIAAYVSLVLICGWRFGTLRYHALRAARVAAGGVILVILGGFVALHTMGSLGVLGVVIALIAADTMHLLRSRDDIERANAARRASPLHYLFVALGVGALLVGLHWLVPR